MCKITAVISKYNSRYGDFSFAPENNKLLLNCKCIGIVGDLNGCRFFLETSYLELYLKLEADILYTGRRHQDYMLGKYELLIPSISGSRIEKR